MNTRTSRITWFRPMLIMLCSMPMAVAAAKKVTYEEVAVTDGVSITGKVTFEGDHPAAKTKTINKDIPTCGEGEREYNITTIGDDGSVLNAVVYIEKIAAGKAWDGKEDFELEQAGCAFLPKSYVVRRGADLHVQNKDDVFHNIHSYEIAGKARITMFNSGQPANSEFTKPLRMRRRGSHAIKLECDAHNFMHEWMFAADNPYYSVTGEDGAFEIGDVPPGKYKLSVWHPVLGTETTQIEVAAGAASTQAFLYQGKVK